MDSLSAIFKTSPATSTIIVLCCAAFIAESLLGLPLQALSLHQYANPDFFVAQLISYLFLHGSSTHLLLNMLVVWIFGRAMETTLGTRRFLLLYFVSGIGAGITQLAINHYQFEQLMTLLVAADVAQSSIINFLESGRYFAEEFRVLNNDQLRNFYSNYNANIVGASGAAFGLLAAYALCYPNSKLIFLFLPFPIAAKILVPILIGIDIVAGLSGVQLFGHNIAHFAHIGGAVTGALLMLYYRRRLPH